MERKLLTLCYWFCEGIRRGFHPLYLVWEAAANGSIYFYNLRSDFDLENTEPDLPSIKTPEYQVYKPGEPHISATRQI